MRTPKYYLVIDLEATCDAERPMPRNETEIIEIGALLCDGQTLCPEAEFQTFVRPVRHPRLTPFCVELTTIRQSDVDGAPTFPGDRAFAPVCRRARFSVLLMGRIRSQSVSSRCRAAQDQAAARAGPLEPEGSVSPGQR
jgi:hypothetical protein